VDDATEAEDIAQEVLLRAGLDPAGLLAAERADAWLLRVCRHVAIDYVRARRVRQAVWGPMPDENEHAGEDRRAGSRAAADWRRFKLRRRAPPEARGARGRCTSQRQMSTFVDRQGSPMRSRVSQRYDGSRFRDHHRERQAVERHGIGASSAAWAACRDRGLPAALAVRKPRW